MIKATNIKATNIKAENNDNMFLISNSNSPIQNRMMQQASFIR